MKIPKRVITKVGDVFNVASDKYGTWYLQLVYLDVANMNSDVVIGIHLSDDDQDMAITETVKLSYTFYLHTTVKFGVKEGLLEKIGNVPVVADISNMSFKYYRDHNHIEILRRTAERTGNRSLAPKYAEPYWDIWTLGDASFHSVSGEEGNDTKAEPGAIFPPQTIIERIKIGRTIY